MKKRWPLLFGLIFGVILAWIFAPEKGKDLRRKMQKDRENGKLGLAPLTRDVSGAIHEAAQSASQLYKSKKVVELAEKGHETLKEVTGHVTKHFKDEIDFVKELYRQSNREVPVHFQTHAIAAPAKKAVTKKSAASRTTPKKKVGSKKSPSRSRKQSSK